MIKQYIYNPQRAVQKGLAFLDKHIGPEWINLVDRDIAQAGILSQVWGKKAVGEAFIVKKRGMPIQLGFKAPYWEPEYVTKQLIHEWKHQIKLRKEAKNV